MAHRQFKDQEGRLWEAWDVHPMSVARKLRAERAEQSGREVVDDEGTFALPNALRDGWLAFQTAGETRRLAPIPSNWDQRSDRALAELARSAEPIQRRRPHLSSEEQSARSEL